MKRFKVAAVGCIALMGAILTPTAIADDWNRKTVVTFSGPVEIPGVHPGWGVLPAGTYVFKILDSQPDRQTAQIFNKEETTIDATILAIPNYRLKAMDKTVITFSERPSGEPEALRAWFYPGRNWGEEFVYPKAIALAKATKTPVLFTAVEIPLEVTEPMKLVDAPGVAELKLAPPAAQTQVATAPASKVRENQLPATSSELPLLAVFGLLAIGVGAAVRAVAKRRQ